MFCYTINASRPDLEDTNKILGKFLAELNFNSIYFNTTNILYFFSLFLWRVQE